MGRELVFIGDIDDASAKEFLEEFWALDATVGDISINMCSSGGEEAAGWAIYDALMCSNNTIGIIGYGEISSMALLVLQAADVRVLSPNCRLLLHDGTGASVKNPAAHVVIALGKEQEYGNLKYARALESRSELSFTKIRELSSAETYFSAKEAVVWGLADTVLETRKKEKA